MVGYAKQRKEGEKEKNSCGDMVSEMRNRASTWVIRTRRSNHKYFIVY